MPNFTTPPVLTAATLFSSSATQQHELGVKAWTTDGREFRYCQAGATALVVGNVIQSPVHDILWMNAGVAAAAINATAVTVTAGAVTAVLNYFAEGLMIVSTTPGIGYAYPISGHAAISSATAFTLNLKSDSPIQVALTTDSKVDLQVNPYRLVIQAPVTTLTGTIVGVAQYPIVANEYGWLQTKGVGGVLIDTSTPANFSMLGSPSAAAGAVAIHTAALTIVGTSMSVGVANKVKPVLISIN